MSTKAKGSDDSVPDPSQYPLNTWIMDDYGKFMVKQCDSGHRYCYEKPGDTCPHCQAGGTTFYILPGGIPVSEEKLRAEGRWTENWSADGGNWSSKT